MSAVGCPLPLAPGQRPRAWQVAALDAVTAAFRGPAGLRSVLVSAATGTGKGTLLAGLAVRSALSAGGRRVLVLCHRRELLEDLRDRVLAIVRGLPPEQAAGLTVGLVRASENAARARIVVASVQTLKAGRLAEALAGGAPPLVIVDEAHHATAKSYRAILAAVEAALGRPPHVVGLTATPYRTGKDGATAGLGSAFAAHVYDHGIVEAIRAGDLVPPTGVRVDLDLGWEPGPVDLSGVRLSAGGDYDEEDLADAIDVDARNEAVARYVAERLDGRQALAFGVSIAHAKRLAEALRAAGVQAEAVWGGTAEHPLAPTARAALISRFLRGDLRVLVSRDLLFEGFDAPPVEVLIACRPTRSPIIAAQLVGRGLRLHTFPDGRIKQGCEVWDFCGFLDGVQLAIPADMSAGEKGPASAAAAVRELQVGDIVELVLPPSRGLGQVLRASEGTPLVQVRWPDAETEWHGRPELRRVKPEAGPAMQVPIYVRGMTETTVYLLPGQAPEQARAWVWAIDAWVCSAQVRRAAEGAEQVTARGLCRQVAPGDWEAWVGVWEGRECARLDRITGRPVGLPDAQRLVDAALDEAGARRGGWSAPWRAEPATERQVQALQRLGRRLTAGLSKGEAGDLLDAQIVRRAVRDANKHQWAAEAAGGGDDE